MSLDNYEKYLKAYFSLNGACIGVLVSCPFIICGAWVRYKRGEYRHALSIIKEYEREPSKFYRYTGELKKKRWSSTPLPHYVLKQTTIENFWDYHVSYEINFEQNRLYEEFTKNAFIDVKYDIESEFYRNGTKEIEATLFPNEKTYTIIGRDYPYKNVIDILMEGDLEQIKQNLEHNLYQLNLENIFFTATSGGIISACAYIGYHIV